MKAVRKIVIAVIVTIFSGGVFDIYPMKEHSESTGDSVQKKKDSLELLSSAKENAVFNLEEQRVQERPIPDELRQPGDVWLICGGKRRREVQFCLGDFVQKKKDSLELLPCAENDVFNLEEQRVQERPIPDELRQPGAVWYVCGGKRRRQVRFCL
jgi:hypothetical protein